MPAPVNSQVENVSDTALWVATFRAWETRSKQPLFQDIYAAELAGERGEAIARAMSFTKFMHWMMAIRTVAIDQLIKDALDAGADAVINLGCGLDTRPYRLALPANLLWVEIDFPHMIQYKAQKLQRAQPVCKLERIGIDVADETIRNDTLHGIAQRAQRILVITEGVLPYLTNDAVISLSNGLRALPSMRYWIQDFRSDGIKRRVPKSWKKRLSASPFQFDVDDWLGFFTSRGWAVKKAIFNAEESQRLKRPMPFFFPWSLIFKLLPRKKRDKMGKQVGCVMFEAQRS